MAFSNRTKSDSSSSVLNAVSYLSPFQLDIKGLSIPGAYRIRILSLDQDDTEMIWCYKAKIKNPANQAMMAINIHSIDDDRIYDLEDQEGTPLSQCPKSPLYRLPIFVKSKRNAEGKEEMIEKVMFWEFGPGPRNDLQKLNSIEVSDGAFLFDEDTNSPNYDIRLVKSKSAKPGFPYEMSIEPVHTKGNTFDPSFNVPVEKDLKDYMDLIDGNWDALREEMGKRQTYEDIVKQLTPRKEKGGYGSRQDLAYDANPDKGSEGGKDSAEEGRPAGRSRFGRPTE